MPWIYVLVAGVLEVAWAVGLKYTHGFTRLVPSVLTIIGMILSFVVLAQGVKSLPVGTAYAVWTGIGAVGTATYGMVKLNEPVNPMRITCLALIVIGIVGLKLGAKE